MKKLVKILFRYMRLAVHYNYLDEVRRRLTAAGEAVVAAVAPYMPDFALWLGREEDVAQWQYKSELTKDIEKTDKDIESLIVAIDGLVLAGRHSTGSAIKASGEKVYDKMKHYGRITRKPYTEQIGDLKFLLDDFTGALAHDVDNLGMGMQVQLLGVATNKFVTLLNQRGDERIDKPAYSSVETRRHLDEIYAQIEFTINANAATATSEDAAEFITFIEHLNPEIERVNAEVRPARIDLSTPGYTFIVDVPDQIFTDEPCTPSLTVYVRLNDKEPVRKLEDGRHYITTYKNNIKVGKATATIHGKGKYKGSVSITFNIARKPTPNE
jgi:hypothetical protein